MILSSLQFKSRQSVIYSKRRRNRAGLVPFLIFRVALSITVSVMMICFCHSNVVLAIDSSNKQYYQHPASPHFYSANPNLFQGGVASSDQHCQSQQQLYPQNLQQQQQQQVAPTSKVNTGNDYPPSNPHPYAQQTYQPPPQQQQPQHHPLFYNILHQQQQHQQQQHQQQQQQHFHHPYPYQQPNNVLHAHQQQHQQKSYRQPSAPSTKAAAGPTTQRSSIGRSSIRSTPIQEVTSTEITAAAATITENSGGMTYHANAALKPSEQQNQQQQLQLQIQQDQKQKILQQQQQQYQIPQQRQQQPFSLPDEIPVKTVDDYLLVRRLGTGKFSDVFEAVDVALEQESKVAKILRRTSSKHNLSSERNEEDSDDYDLYDDDDLYDEDELDDIDEDSEGLDDHEVDPETLVVIKCLKPVSDRKIRREVLILHHIRQLPNLVRLLAIVVRNNQSRTQKDNHQQQQQLQEKDTDLPQMPSLVLEHAGPNSQWLCHPRYFHGSQQQQSFDSKVDGSAETSAYFLSDYEIRYYLYHLLVALDALHSNGVMHRDIKPRNVLINRNPYYHQFYQRQQQQNREQEEKEQLSVLSGSKASYSMSLRSKYLKHQQRREQRLQQLQQQQQQYDYFYRPLKLIDLGLADFYEPGKSYNVRVASRHYKSPELLLGFELYDYAIDMFAFGCILAGLLFRREPFFRGKDNNDQLAKIVAVLGTDDLFQYLKRHDLTLEPHLEDLLNEQQGQLPTQRQYWSVLYGRYRIVQQQQQSKQRNQSYSAMSTRGAAPSGASNSNGSSASSTFTSYTAAVATDGLDLLDKLLVYDHQMRLTAKQAMEHPFFDVVRHRVQTQLMTTNSASA